MKTDEDSNLISQVHIKSDVENENFAKLFNQILLLKTEIRNTKRIQILQTIVLIGILFVSIIFFSVGYNSNLTSTLSNLHTMSNDPIVYLFPQSKKDLEYMMQKTKLMVQQFYEPDSEPLPYDVVSTKFVKTANSTLDALNELIPDLIRLRPTIDHLVSSSDALATRLDLLFGGNQHTTPSSSTSP
jgi:hypothetical protein